MAIEEHKIVFCAGKEEKLVLSEEDCEELNFSVCDRFPYDKWFNRLARISETKIIAAPYSDGALREIRLSSDC